MFEKCGKFTVTCPTLGHGPSIPAWPGGAECQRRSSVLGSQYGDEEAEAEISRPHMPHSFTVPRVRCTPVPAAVHTCSHPPRTAESRKLAPGGCLHCCQGVFPLMEYCKTAQHHAAPLGFKRSCVLFLGSARTSRRAVRRASGMPALRCQ